MLPLQCFPTASCARYTGPARIAWHAIEDAIHDGDLKRVGDLGELPSEWRGPALVVTDHGNATLYDTGGDEVWSVV